MDFGPTSLFMKKINKLIKTNFNEYTKNATDNEIRVVSQFLNNIEIRKEFSTYVKGIEAKISSKILKSISISDKHREEGNRLFKADKKGNALAASRCYTDAILAAPMDSPALALAHANRAAALVEFGYYVDAYCDCSLALQLGYPLEKQVKILIRQAYCAVKMKDYFKLENVLEKLRDMKLNGQYAKQKEDLEIQLKIIAELPGNWHQDDPHDYKVQNILVNPEKGRYMTAWKNYQKDDVILSEKAFAFVPVNNSKCCSYCAKQHFIPYPCYTCSKIVYCSQKCKLADEKIHQYECFGHKYGILDAMGITHLAMHALISGLPEFLAELIKCSSAMEIWQQIENIGNSRKKGYPEMLALYNNLHLLAPEEIRALASGAIMGANYLVYCTTFSELYTKSPCSNLDWLVIISALILRHVVQMMVNAQSNIGVTFMDSYYLAMDDIWTQPQHLKKGLLHGFCDSSVNSSGIYPYLSLCNHSCEQCLRLNFDGNRVIAKTQKELKKGDEIFNTYVLGCRKDSKSNRTGELRSYYDFECDCKHCVQEANDEEYLKFHQYRCRNSECYKLFTPLLEDLRWWLKIKDVSGKLVKIECPFCKNELDINWFIEFDELLDVGIWNTSQLKVALKLFKHTQETQYASELRQYMAYEIVSSFFKIWEYKEIVNEQDLFKEIGQIIKQWLDDIEEQNDVESVLYATGATFAIDLIAGGTFFDFDRKKIRRSFDMLSTEIRTIFENYIKDYIGDEFDDVENE